MSDVTERGLPEVFSREATVAQEQRLSQLRSAVEARARALEQAKAVVAKQANSEQAGGGGFDVFDL